MSKEKAKKTTRLVLIIEDEPDAAHTIKGTFEDNGIAAVVVSSFDEFKAAIEKGLDPSEIVTDGLEGDWEKVVRNAKTVPVRLHSSDLDYQKKARGMGIDVVAKTPDSPQILLKELSKAGIK